MAAKSVTITDVRVTSSVRDNQRTRRGTPDIYVLFSSQVGSAGDREQYVRNNASPTFAGPYTLSLGGPQDAEDINVEVWDYDPGRPSNDDLMESVVASLGAESAGGSRTWQLSQGGSVTFTWRVQGRPAPAPVSPPAGSPAAGEGSAGDGSTGDSALRQVRISRLTLQDLLPRDGRRGVVDPYVILTGLSSGAQERWSTKRDDGEPAWEEEKTLVYDPSGYAVEVWDDDFGQGNGDDLLGNVELQLPRGEDRQSARLTLLFRGREYQAGEIALSYAVIEPLKPPAPPEPQPPSSTEPTEPEPPAPPAGPQIVTRRELRKMPAAEQQRFVAALKRLMENQSGPQTSEYFRIAGFHGWPSDNCQHGQETFPGWHRGYLVELERALIKADKELGNDGNIGVPYWDWTDLSSGEIMPRVIRDNFAELPDGFLDSSDSGAGALARRGFSRLHDEEQLRLNLESARVTFQAEQCLAVSEHWMHASTRFNRQGYSVESPHNSVHVACGFPMTSVRYAAFHPIFFLHHCNVDRIYEKHVQMETAQECAQEFSSRQLSLVGEGERNRYTLPLPPFNHPFTGEPLMPRDTFDTRGLGYVYDELPPTPAMQLREAPVFAAFLKLPVMKFANKSYMVYVFVMPKDDAKSWKAAGGLEDWVKDDKYAGCGAIFGSKGAECANCLDRKPFNVLVEVQEALRKQKLSRHDAGVRAMVRDEEDQVKPLEETEIDPPVLCGPTFEDAESSLSTGSSGGEVEQLQLLLSALGYSPGLVDGKFGPKTQAAVERFQHFTSLKKDGIAGKVTKGQLLKPRFDLCPDVETATKEVNPIVAGSTVVYTIGHLPGYLDKVKARAEIHEAFEMWGQALNVSFSYTGAALRASLRVDFQDLSAVGEALGGGLARPGGQLAEASRKGIKLDAAERWLLRRQAVPERFKQAVYLFPVMVHEIGHVLGLSHSSNPEDVMWPYLKSDPHVQLSANDIARGWALQASAFTAPRATANGEMRRELAELRSDVTHMRAEMREMSRIIAAAFAGAPAGSGAKAVVGSKGSGSG